MRIFILQRLGKECARLATRGLTPALQSHASFLPPSSLPSARLRGASTSAAAKSKSKSSSPASDQEEFISDAVEQADAEEAPSERQVVVENDTLWGQQALECTQQVLSASEDLALYAFRAVAGNKSVDIRLDKLSDTYGSPTLDEIGAFSRDFNERFEAMVGEEEAGSIEIEVSSPGATRAVKVPEELERFKGLPMEVVTVDHPEVRVMTFVGFHDEGDPADGGSRADSSEWMYSDVKANRSLNKGRGLNKKARETVFVVPHSDIQRVNLHIDL
jgi:ribosome maturation factor RimP